MLEKLLLIRHGELPDEFGGRLVGRTDPPLSEKGCASCRELVARLASAGVERWYVSPLRRCVETFEIISGKGVEAFFDNRIREIDFGRWENLTFAEIQKIATQEQLNNWLQKPEQMCFPGGESSIGFRARVDEFFDELLAGTNRVVAVITHGGVLMHFLSRLHGVTSFRQIPPPPRGSLTELNFKNGKLLP